jgi:hypothetical protein
VPGDLRPLAALNTTADEWPPAFRGDALYFASDRSGGVGGLDSVRATYADGAFGTVRALAGAIQSPYDDCDPARSRARMRSSSLSNRWWQRLRPLPADPSADGSTWEITLLTALASPADEREPAFTADGRTLFFASIASAGHDFDLYRASLAAEGEWSAAGRPRGTERARDEARAPARTDDFSLYFARARELREPRPAARALARALPAARQAGGLARADRLRRVARARAPGVAGEALARPRDESTSAT